MNIVPVKQHEGSNIMLTGPEGEAGGERWHPGDLIEDRTNQHFLITKIKHEQTQQSAKPYIRYYTAYCLETGQMGEMMLIAGTEKDHKKVT